MPSLLVIDSVPLNAERVSVADWSIWSLIVAQTPCPGQVAFNLLQRPLHFGADVAVSIDLALLLGGHGRVEGGLDRADVEEVGALAGGNLGGGEDALRSSIARSGSSDR